MAASRATGATAASGRTAPAADAPAPPASTLGLQGPPVEGGGARYRRVTRRRLAYADTLILAIAITGVVFIVWQLSRGEVNLNDGLVALVTASLTSAVSNARTSREYYFGGSAPEQED